MSSNLIAVSMVANANALAFCCLQTILFHQVVKMLRIVDSILNQNKLTRECIIMSNQNLPFFKYNPNAYQDKDYFSTQDNICRCCENPTNMWTEWMYCVDEIDCVCAHCIADGSAAQKFNGEFICPIGAKTPTLVCGDTALSIKTFQ